MGINGQGKTSASVGANGLMGRNAGFVFQKGLKGNPWHS